MVSAHNKCFLRFSSVFHSEFLNFICTLHSIFTLFSKKISKKPDRSFVSSFFLNHEWNGISSECLQQTINKCVKSVLEYMAITFAIIIIDKTNQKPTQAISEEG